MSTRRLGPARLLLVAAAALLTACSSGGDSAGQGAPPPPAEDTGPLKGPLLVFAATPLTAPLQEAQRALGAEAPTLKITYTFAGRLDPQLGKSVPADVVATADQDALRKLTAAKLIGTPAVFARDKLRIAVAKGNPKGVRALSDLAKPGVKVALLDAGTPGGRDSRRLFDSRDLTVTPTSAPLEAKDAVAALGSGKADATVLYAAEVAAAGDSVTGVTIPDAQNIVSSYRIAVLKSAKNPEAAQAYVNWLVNGPGQKLVTAHGLLTP
jgi:molybdate transport system substrate-binding protein